MCFVVPLQTSWNKISCCTCERDCSLAPNHLQFSQHICSRRKCQLAWIPSWFADPINSTVTASRTGHIQQVECIALKLNHHTFLLPAEAFIPQLPITSLCDRSLTLPLHAWKIILYPTKSYRTLQKWFPHHPYWGFSVKPHKSHWQQRTLILPCHSPPPCHVLRNFFRFIYSKFCMIFNWNSDLLN